MKNKITPNDELNAIVIGGLIVVAVFVLVPSLIRLGAFTYEAAFRRFGKCFEATVQHEDGTIEKIRITRREAEEMGFILVD